jgi:hypothetical protein
MAQAVLEVVWRRTLDREAHPHAAGEREELVGPQPLGEPSVAGQHDGQQDVGIEIGRGEQTQFGEHGRLHFLRVVRHARLRHDIDHQHGPRQRALDVGLPALAQDFRAGEAIMRAQFVVRSARLRHDTDQRAFGTTPKSSPISR